MFIRKGKTIDRGLLNASKDKIVEAIEDDGSLTSAGRYELVAKPSYALIPLSELCYILEE